jgi:hypothetical protein
VREWEAEKDLSPSVGCPFSLASAHRGISFRSLLPYQYLPFSRAGATIYAGTTMCSPRLWSNASRTAPSSRNLQSCELCLDCFCLLQGWLSSGPIKPAYRASSLDEGSGHLIGEGLHNVPDLVYLDLM